MDTPKKKNANITDYFLKGVDSKLWKRIKMMSVDKEISIKKMILNSLKEKLSEYEKDKK